MIPEIADDFIDELYWVIGRAYESLGWTTIAEEFEKYMDDLDEPHKELTNRDKWDALIKFASEHPLSSELEVEKG